VGGGGIGKKKLFRLAKSLFKEQILGKRIIARKDVIRYLITHKVAKDLGVRHPAGDRKGRIPFFRVGGGEREGEGVVVRTRRK
jgi:hypothetical protein